MSQISLQENDAKLDGIEANANNYSHPTGNGNNHIPSGGSTDQVLKYASAGTAQWADASGGSRVLLNRSVMNNTSSYNFTALNSSLYDNYYVEWHGLAPSNGGSSSLDLYLSDDGLTSTDSDIWTRVTKNGGTISNETVTGKVRLAVSVGTYSTANSNHGNQCSGHLTLWNMHSGSDLSTSATGQSVYRTNAGTNNSDTIGAVGDKYGTNSQNTHDSFKINFHGGSTNMVKGTIAVYGILK